MTGCEVVFAGGKAVFLQFNAVAFHLQSRGNQLIDCQFESYIVIAVSLPGGVDIPVENGVILATVPKGKSPRF